MPKLRSLRPNALGDLRAEADTTMLARAFLETADYRTLIETSDRPIVVGRRGTGKSALARQLHHFFYREGNTVVISISPEEDQTIGLRARLALHLPRATPVLDVAPRAVDLLVDEARGRSTAIKLTNKRVRAARRRAASGRRRGQSTSTGGLMPGARQESEGIRSGV